MIIGFIGLGIMGKPMCKNLISKGHELVVYDIQGAAVEQMAKSGTRIAASPAQVASQCNRIITMLPNSPHVNEAVCGKQGVLEGAKHGSILMDMSSIAPLASREIAKKCAQKGVHMLDAPVSGGEPKAIDGTLSIMAGGDKAIFDKVYDIFMCMGASAVYCGTIGAGNTAKLANQVIVAVNIAALSEALIFSSKAGVDPELVLDAIRGGLAGSTVMNAKGPMMLQHNFNPGFTIDLHIKDLANALETAYGVGVPLPLAATVMEMMLNLQSAGCGQQDHSVLTKYYEKLAGKPIKSRN